MSRFNSKPKHLVSLLLQKAICIPDKIAYVCLENSEHPLSITYGELDKKARAIATKLQNNNLFSKRVLLLYPTGLDFIYAFLGCLYAGVIPIPTALPKNGNFIKLEDTLHALAQHAEIEGILTTSLLLQEVQANFTDLEIEKKIFIIETSSISISDSNCYQPIQIKPNSIAYLQYTSGSTSNPKAVIICHDNLFHNIKYSAKAWHYSKSSVSLTWAPHTHVYGLVCGLLVPLYHGSVTIIVPVETIIRRPVSWLETIMTHRVTHTGGPNFIYDLCVKEIKENELVGLKLSSWRVAIYGGDSTQQQTLLKFTKKFSSYGFKFKRFCPGYGMSELSGTVALSQYGKNPIYFSVCLEALRDNKIKLISKKTPHEILVSNGRLIPGLKAIIVDPLTGLPLSERHVGEIWLTGKSLARGYWREPELTNESFNLSIPGRKELFFRTGDLGFKLKNYICVTGRLKEVIIIYGKKYYPLNLELTIADALHDFGVNEARVVFSEIIEEKEEVIVLQETKNSSLSTLQAEEIINIIRDSIFKKYNISLYAVVLVQPSTLPKTASGKLQRKICQTSFAENKLSTVFKYLKTDDNLEVAPSIVSPQQEVSDQELNQSMLVIKQNFARLVAEVLDIKTKDVDLTRPMSVYSFDSLNIVKLISKINETYQLSMTPDRIYGYETLTELLQAITETTDHILDLPHHDIFKTPIMPDRDIAIIGMSGLFPGADNLDMFWDNLINGVDVISEIPKGRWDWKSYLDSDKTQLKWGGFINGVSEFDAKFFNMTPREAELTDPQQRIFLQTVWHAIEDAGYTSVQLAKLTTGLFVGAFSNDYAELMQKFHQVDAYFTTGMTHSMLANRVSYLLNLQGPSIAVDTACSSSLVAIHHAVQAILDGDCEVAIAGAVNLLLSPTNYLAASKASMLSPEGRCKTFDKSANGYVRSEGVAAILLKPLTKAKLDGDHIYGVIKGSAVNHGGHVSSLTVPNPNAQAEVIVAACQRGQIPVESITLIETHGTGTSLGDPIELNGLIKAFDSLSQQSLSDHYCGLGAVKSNVGHLEAAAGMAGVIKTLLAMQYGKLPGNLHFNELNPYADLDSTPFYIIEKTQNWVRVKNKAGKVYPRRAGVSSFGFGGTNAHIILEEASLQPQNSKVENIVFPIVISAKTEVALKQRIYDLHSWLQHNTTHQTLAAISFTLSVGRQHFMKRCMFIATSLSELEKILLLAINAGHHEDIIDTPQVKNESDCKDAIDVLCQKIRAAFDSKSQYFHDEIKQQQRLLGQHYVSGKEIDWEQLYPAEMKQRISMPNYPFAKDKHWFTKQNEFMLQLSSETKIIEKSTPKISGDIEQDIKILVADLTKIKLTAIDVLQPLSEMGFDSISFKELALKVEALYNITLLPTIFYSQNTIKALSEYLAVVSDCLVNPIESVPIANSFLGNEPIAVIGMQGRFPKSNDLNIFWQHLEAGEDLITEIPLDRWDWREWYGDPKNDPTKTNSKWGGVLDNIDKFDAAFFNISPREANFMDPQQRLFLEVVWQAIEDAGYDPLSLSGQKVGVFAGVEFSEYQTLIASQKNLFHGYIATGTSPALLANRVSYFFDFQGPSEVIDTACSSALVAINRAVQAIQSGECETAIAGGVSLMLNPETFVITSQLGVLSPDGRCKTFAKSANGYVKGEGVAAIMLKSLSKAKADGDTIYGVIKASGVNHGGKAQSLTAPNAMTQAQLITKVYSHAAIDPATVSYIEVHGTGTELGDPIEIEGLKLAFNQLQSSLNKAAPDKPYCGLGAVKTNIGHLEPASGMAGVIKVLLAMQHEKIPGNLHCDEVNPYIKLDDSAFYLINKTQTWQRLKDDHDKDIPRRAGVSSFGFGGTCAHVLLEEVPNNSSPIVITKPYYLITLSAKNEESLKQKIIELRDWLKKKVTTSLAALSYTLNCGRSHFSARCGFVVSSITGCIETLDQISVGVIPNYCLIKMIQIEDFSGPVFNEIYHSALASLTNDSSISPEVYRDKLLLIADLYTKNFKVDWLQLYDESYQTIPGLPAYPFIKQRYWYDAELQTSISTPSVVSFSTMAAEKFDAQNFCYEYLKQIFSDKLKLSLDKIAIDETYENYGVDSLLSLEITQYLEKDFGSLPKTLLYEKSQIRDLAGYLQKKYPDTINRLAGIVGDNLASSNTSPKTFDEQDKKGEIHQNETMDIAIIGLSGTYPLAKDIEEFWQNLVEGRDCITEIPRERWDYKAYPIRVGDEDKYYKYGGFIPDVDKFDPLFFNIAPREAVLMDPQERLFLQSAWSTLEDAGYTRQRLEETINNEVGVFVGVTYNYYPLFIAEEWQKGNYLPLDIQLFSCANRVSYYLNLNGPSYVIDTACSSSLAAVHSACESILRGECSMAIAGGVNLSLHPAKYHFLGSFSFLSEQGRCTSFGAGGNGYVPAEAVGSLLLKPLSLALRDADRIYGIIKASSMNHGGKTSGYTVPNPNAQAELVKMALTKANIDPRTISYIEAHGTGTPLGDPIEIRGLQEAYEEFTQDKQYCAIGSVKSNIGHAEAAAGISQITKVLLQMRHKKLVPSLHAKELNPYIDFTQTPFYVQQELTDWPITQGQPRRAGVSSFGAGGTNIHLIIEEYIPSVEINTPQEDINLPFVLLISALNEERLTQYIQRYDNFLTKEAIIYKSNLELDAWLRNVCYTSQIGRESMKCRIAISAESFVELSQKLKSVQFTQKKEISKITAQEIKELANQRQLKQLASYWEQGMNIPWEECYQKIKPNRVSLPSYPFAKRRCWVGTSSLESIKIDKPTQEANLPAINEWLYSVDWEPILSLNTIKNKQSTDKWLIFSDKELGFLLQDELGKENCLYCFSGDKYEKFNNRVTYINPTSIEDYEKLINGIFNETQGELRGIIYLSWFHGSDEKYAETDLYAASKSAETSFVLLHIFKNLIQKEWKNHLIFSLISRGSQSINSDNPIQIWQHYLWSMARIFAAEQGNYKVLLLDLDPNKKLRQEARIIATELQQYQAGENHVAYRNETRYGARLASHNLPVDVKAKTNYPLSALITGGLGALGNEVATLLADKGTKYLLLTGMTSLPPRSEWATVQDEVLKQKILDVTALENKGVRVRYVTVDVADKVAMQNVIRETEKEWEQEINGVFHLAGITTDNVPIAEMSPELMEKVLAVKIQGSLVLHDLFQKSNLNCFVLFSSIAALPYFGMSGLSAYAMANEFLNGLALYRRQRGLTALSIDWAAWADKGMSFKYNHSEFLAAVGMSVVSLSQGIKILDMLLMSSSINVGVFKIDWKKFTLVNPEIKKLPFFSRFTTQKVSDEQKPELTPLSYEQIMTLVISALAQSLALDPSEIDKDSPYQNYGLDSIIGINFVSALSEYFPDVLSPMDLYRYPTVNQLVVYIMEKCSLSVNDSISDSEEFNESKYLNEISQLSTAEVCQLIDSELMQIDELFD